MKIFLATPISSYSDDGALTEYKKRIREFIQELKKDHMVFSELEHIADENDYDTPEQSLLMDMNAIKESDMFILHMPRYVPTSALIELGIAIAERKKIIIISPDINILPYLAIGLINMSNAIFIASESISSECAVKINHIIKKNAICINNKRI